MTRKRLTNKERKRIFNKWNGHCAYCGCEIEFTEMQVDHLNPLHLGGEDTIWNMMPSCRSCNKYKHTLTLEKFREAIESWTDVLERGNTTYRNAVRYGQIQPTPTPVSFYFEHMGSVGGEE